MPDKLSLVVDDEQPVRAFVASVLKQNGFQVLEADNGAAALALVEQHRGHVDLVVTDFEMPQLNGGELIQALRAKYQAIPVVMISGNLPSAEGERFRDPTNRCAFLAKPFLPKELVGAIRGLTAKAPLS